MSSVSWRRCLRHNRLLAPGDVCADCAPLGAPLDTTLFLRTAEALAEQAAALRAENRQLRDDLAACQRELAHARGRLQELEWAHG